ncbi:MAG TPA: hypothetical protein VEJ89_16530 [Myxococcaceae bacterium]|jgi:hypothetical protein|nr:hypothetical protein [Myxococcaceae bacterium]
MRVVACALSIVWLAGCSSSSTDLSAWVGNWNSAAQQDENCTTGTHTTPLTGVLPIIAGPASDTIVTQSPNGCNLTWTVSGNTATLQANQTCTVPGSTGGTWHATFTSGGLTLNGNQLVLGDAGTAILDINGTQVSCTFAQAGSLTKT